MADEKQDDSGGTKTDREVTPGKGGKRPTPTGTTRSGEKDTGGGSGTKTDRGHAPKGKAGR